MSAPVPATSFDMSPQSESPRFRRPGWKDTRLLIGILLVVLSIVGTLLIIRSADTRSGYWVATSDTSPGTPLTRENFTVVEANLDDAGALYWPAEEELPEQFTLSATVRQGELVPRGAVTDRDPENRQQLAVTVAAEMASSITTGSRVDAWISWPNDMGQGFSAAEQAANFIEVVAVEESTSGFGSGNTRSVHLLLPHEALPEFLDAQAVGARISIVPAAVATTGA